METETILDLICTPSRVGEPCTCFTNSISIFPVIMAILNQGTWYTGACGGGYRLMIRVRLRQSCPFSGVRAGIDCRVVWQPRL